MDTLEERKKLGLPTEDTELMYHILTQPYGVPIHVLCIWMGLRPNDFTSCWGILRNLEREKDLKIVVRGGRGSPALISIKGKGLAKEYTAWLKLMKEAGLLRKKKFPKKKVWSGLDADLERLQRVWCILGGGEFMKLEAEGILSQDCRSLLARWLKYGWIAVTYPGGRGRGNSARHKITPKGLALMDAID